MAISPVHLANDYQILLRTYKWRLILTRMVASIFLLITAPGAWSQVYGLPFNGLWFVWHGGDTQFVNQHMSFPPQRFGIDFVKIGGTNRSLTRPPGTTVNHYYSWGEVVLSPVDGEIVAVVDAFQDNTLGTKDPRNSLGNYVAIKAADDRYVFLAHLQRDSIIVHQGQHVTRGEPLAKCGNSGNTDFPHLHMHVQNVEKLNAGIGQNIEFSSINVELAGKSFRDVKWPLIRGLFVSNE